MSKLIQNLKTENLKIANPAGTSAITLTNSGGNYALELPQNIGTTDYLLRTDGTNSSSWVAPAFKDSLFAINDASDATKQIKFDPTGTTGTSTTITSSQTANRIITLFDATDTLVGIATTDTLTNKTMTGATNTLTASLLKSATTEVSVSAATAPTNGQVLTATSGTTATWQTPSGGGGNTFLDNVFAINDSGDATKQILFDAGGTTSTATTILAAQTANRTLTLPDITDTLVSLTATQTLTNKTATGATNTLTASLLKTATTEVSVSSATAPTNGQVLTASSGTAAAWVTPTGTSVISYLGVGSTVYNTGTVEQSSVTVTGSGTTFTSAMIGGIIVYSTGATASITAFGSTTSLTVSQSQTITAGTTYNIYYGGLQSDSAAITSTKSLLLNGATSGYTKILPSSTVTTDYTMTLPAAPPAGNVYTSSFTSGAVMSFIPLAFRLQNTTTGNIYTFGFGSGSATGTNNIGIGQSTMQSLTSGGFNTVIGYNNAYYVASGSYNNIVGWQNCANSGLISNSNTLVFGNDSLSKVNADSNIVVGTTCGNQITTGASNILIGNTTGNVNLTTGSNNIVLGNNVDLAANGSNNFVIGSGITSIIKNTDNTCDLGTTTARFKNALLSGGLILSGTAGSNSITQQASASTTAYSVTWPATQGASSTYLQNNGSGVLSWATVSGGSNILSYLAAASSTYSTGTVGQSTTTVTGSGTTFTDLMVGGIIVYSTLVTAYITAFGSATSLTVSQSQTVTAGTSYTIYYGGLQTDSAQITTLQKLLLPGSTSGYTRLFAGAAVTSYDLTLPTTQGSSGTTINNNGSGVLTWAQFAAIPASIINTSTALIGLALTSVTSTASTIVGVGSGKNSMSGTANTIVGNASGTALTTGANNIIMGYNAGIAFTTHGNNTIIGTDAGKGLISDNNIAVGRNALGNGASTVGSLIGIGFGAGAAASGTASIYIGSSSGLVNTGNNNVMVGDTTGYNLITGSGNTLIGDQAGRNTSFTSGSNNTCLGVGATPNGVYSNSIALGYNATIDADDTCVIGWTGLAIIKPGKDACDLGTYTKKFGRIYGNSFLMCGSTANTGLVHTVSGSIASELSLVWPATLAASTGRALTSDTSGNLSWTTVPTIVGSIVNTTTLLVGTTITSVSSTNSTLIGLTTGKTGMTGTANVIVGGSSGTGLTSGNNNVILGRNSGTGITIGTLNLIIGSGSGNLITTSSSSTIIGQGTATNYADGSSAIILGAGICSTGSCNPSVTVFIGDSAGRASSDIGSVYLGYSAGQVHTTGNFNTALGYSSSRFNTTGGNNVFVGKDAGNNASFTSGSDNTIIGTASTPNGVYSNSSCLGASCTIDASNICVIGNGITVIRTTTDNACDLGNSTVNFKSAYLKGGVTKGTLQQTGATVTLGTDNYYVEADATSNNITVTLPAAASHNGREYVIVAKNNASNTVTVSRSGADNIVILGANNTTTVLANLSAPATFFAIGAANAWYMK